MFLSCVPTDCQEDQALSECALASIVASTLYFYHDYLLLFYSGV